MRKTPNIETPKGRLNNFNRCRSNENKNLRILFIIVNGMPVPLANLLFISLSFILRIITKGNKIVLKYEILIASRPAELVNFKSRLHVYLLL
jgi:hypothetical protein